MSTKDILQAGAGAGAAGTTDPYFKNVSLLLHGDGTNGAQTFVDSSVNNFTITPIGNAQISTTVKKFGTGSMYFDGASYLIGPISSDLAFGTGDFTVEAWVYRNTSTGSYETLFGFDVSGGFLFQIYNNQLEYGIRSTFGEDSGTVVPSGQWVHLALTRQSGVIYFFQNGVLIHTYSGQYATANFTNNSPVIISGYSTSNGRLNGYIDDLRITKGVARYTADFTPPTQAFPNQ